MNWSEDGKLFCYTAPENNDEGMSIVTISLWIIVHSHPNLRNTNLI